MLKECRMVLASHTLGLSCKGPVCSAYPVQGSSINIIRCSINVHTLQSISGKRRLASQGSPICGNIQEQNNAKKACTCRCTIDAGLAFCRGEALLLSPGP